MTGKRLLFGRLSKPANAAARTVCSQPVYMAVQVSVHSDAFYRVSTWHRAISRERISARVCLVSVSLRWWCIFSFDLCSVRARDYR